MSELEEATKLAVDKGNIPKKIGCFAYLRRNIVASPERENGGIEVEIDRRTEQIFSAFAEYIENSGHLDIVYSKKQGYISLYYDAFELKDEEDYSTIVGFAENKPSRLLNTIFCAVRKDVKYDHIGDFGLGDVNGPLTLEEFHDFRDRIKAIIETMSESREYCEAYLDFFIDKYIEIE